MEVEDSPLTMGDDTGGGPIILDDDEEQPQESLQELADRVREVTSMRSCDVRLKDPPASGSPTEVVDDSDVEMVFESPLEALKKLAEQAWPQKRVAIQESGGSAEDMIGLVLQADSQVMKAPCLSKEGNKAWAMEQVETKAKSGSSKDEKLEIQASFKKSDRVRMPWDQAEVDDRQKVFAGWLVIIDEARKCCKAAEMIDQSGEEVLEDIFARKKNGTLQVRLSAMMMYVRWARSKGLVAFPLTEAQCYCYVDGLRRDGAPATRATSFRGALAFCKGTIQLEGVDEVLESTRIAGSSHRSYMTKRVLKQRDALTVNQVMTLEAVVAGREFPMRDRLFAGHCLLCVYGRLRMGDSQGIENEPQVFGGYLEGGTAIHKTDGLRGRARRVLPVVAPAVGVSGLAWAEEFLKLRHLAGLKAMPGMPFLPTPVVGGGWSRAKLATPEATVWLCEVLQKYSGTSSLGNVGAHSLKATALSWMAKAMVHEKVRRLMGYHVKPKDKSVMIYSRDALAEGLETLTGIIERIRNLKFRPDAPRNQRWQHEEEPGASTSSPGVVPDDEGDEEVIPGGEPKLDMLEVPTPDKKMHRIVSLEDLSSESEETDEECGESARNLEAVLRAKIGPPKKANHDLYRHGLTGTLHHGSVTPGKLACGRAITPVMFKPEEVVYGLGSFCKVCQGYAK